MLMQHIECVLHYYHESQTCCFQNPILRGRALANAPGGAPYSLNDDDDDDDDEKPSRTKCLMRPCEHHRTARSYVLLFGVLSLGYSRLLPVSPRSVCDNNADASREAPGSFAIPPPPGRPMVGGGGVYCNRSTHARI